MPTRSSGRSGRSSRSSRSNASRNTNTTRDTDTRTADNTSRTAATMERAASVQRSTSPTAPTRVTDDDRRRAADDSRRAAEDDSRRAAEIARLDGITEREARDAIIENREREINNFDERPRRDEQTLVREDLVRDVSNIGVQETITAREITLVAREVSSASQVELVITGVDSGAARRVTVNIAPGVSRLNREYNGSRPPFATNPINRARDIRSVAGEQTTRTSRNARTGIVSRTGRISNQSTGRSTDTRSRSNSRTR